MSTRFTSGKNVNPEMRYPLLSAGETTPDRYIGGDSTQGFDVTSAPPKLGFWGVTFHDKQINAAMLESGNATTWVFNNIVDPLVPGDQRFVSLGAGLLMKEAMTGKREEIDGYRALSNRISPIINVAQLDQVLTFRDENFDAQAATSEWMDNPTNNTLLSLVAQSTGRDLESILSTARNRAHFVFLQNRELTHAQAMQDIRQYEDDAGFSITALSRVSSFVGNYLLTDPSFVPSVFVGPGSGGLAGKSFLGMKLSGKSIAAGVIPKALTRQQSITRLAAPLMGQRALSVGRVAQTLADSPAAVHAAFSSHVGHRAAVAVELGAYGGAWDVAIQQQRLHESERLFDDPAHQEHWSWAELGLSVGLCGALSYVLAGRGGVHKNEMRKAVVESVGGNPSSPMAHTFDNYHAQGLMDTAGIRFQRAAARVLGDDFDSVAMYLDDGMLHAAGLHRFQIAEAMEELAFAGGKEGLTAAAAHRVLSDLVQEARKVKGLHAVMAEKHAGNQLEQAAFAEALGRAARELPNDASNTDVLKLAAKLMPEELLAVEARMQRRAARSLPAAAGELSYWKEQAAELTEIARRSTLTEAEIDHFGTVAAKLKSLGEANPFEGFAVSRGQRYMSGEIFAPYRARSTSSKLTKAVEKIAATRRLIQELRVFGADGGPNALANARRRLIAAQKKVVALSAAESDRIVVEATSGIREVMEKWTSNPPRTRGDKLRALDEVAATIDFNENALIEDGTMIGRFLQARGINLLPKLAAQGTGINQTVRSTLGVLRELAHEFDSNKLRIGDLNPRQTRLHRSLESVRLDMAARASELVDEYRRLHDAGIFGSSVRFIKYQRARNEFDKNVIKHITGAVLSTDADVISMSKLWARHAKELGTIAEDAGLYKQLENFFPRRWHQGRIMRDPEAFRDALARHFLKGWEGSDDIHLDTLVSMGALRRETDDAGRPMWVHATTGVEVKEGLKRAALAELGLTDDAYLLAMKTADATGLSPMQQSANRTRNHLTGNDTYERLPNGRIRRVSHGAPRSERSRILEESVWTNPELEEFLDWRFLDGAASYFQGSGFRAANTARHQKRWGIPGLTMDDSLDWLESRVMRLDSTTDQKERDSWIAGVATLREKLYLAEGRLPTLRDQTNGLGEWLGDVGTSLAGVMYGSGIGQAVLSTEVMLQTVSKVYGLDDILRHVGDIFKVGFRNRQEMREQAQAMGLTVRQFRLHTLQRMTGDSVYSEGFQFAVVPKILAPFMDVFQAFKRGADATGRLNKTAGAFRAHAAATMTLGGMDYFTTFARMYHVQTSLDEVGRFFRAAEKASIALKESADALDKIEFAAQEAHLLRQTGGKTSPSSATIAAAEAAGGRARLKAWKGIARRSGFGGNWQVAEKMQRVGLLDPKRLAALRHAGEATGSLHDTGMFKTVDFNAMMRFTGETAEQQRLFNESFTALRDMIATTMNKRISEQTLLQAPTAATSRTWLGRTQLAMTSFSRSWFDNNVMDMAQMPMRASVGMMTMFLMGETMNMLLRDQWKGRSIEDSMADIQADPDNFIARALTRLPILGAWGSLAMPLADAVTKDGRVRRVETGESAAEGAMASTLDVVFDTIHGVSPLAEDAEVQSRTWRTAARFIPGYRSWWSGLLARGAEGAGLMEPSDMPGASTGGRYRSRTLSRVDIAPIPEIFEDQILPDSQFAEDLDFLYPEQ